MLVLGRVHVAFMDEYIRVLATWRQEHVLDADSMGIFPEPVRTMDFSSRSPRDHHHQWLSLHIRCLSSTRLSLWASRADILELAVQEGIRPTRVIELHDLVLEEAAALVGRVQGRVVLVLGRVHVAFVDVYIRVLAT